MFKESYIENGSVLTKENQQRLKCQIGVNVQQGNKQQQEQQLTNEQHQEQKHQKRTLDALSLLLQILQSPQKYHSQQGENTTQHLTNTKIIIEQLNQHENNQQTVMIAQNKEQEKHLDGQNEMSMIRNVQSDSKSKFLQQQLQLESVMQQTLSEDQDMITNTQKNFSTLGVKNSHNNNTSGNNTKQLKKQANNPSSKFLFQKNQSSFKPVQPLINLSSSANQPLDITGKSARKSILSNKKPYSISSKHQLSQINHIQSGISMYEQVLAKNFQVINGLLKKLNQIYSHNEGYDKTITEMNQKMHKLQVDNENIHHQFRTSHFAIDKKLNSITNQYSNMLQDLNFLKKIWNQSHGIDKTQFFQRVFSNHCREDAERNERGKWSPLKKRGTRKEKRNPQQSKPFIIESNNYKHNQQSKTNPPDFTNESPSTNNLSHHKLPSSHSVRRPAHHKKSVRLSGKSKNLANLKGLNERSLGRAALLQQISQSNNISESSKESRDEYLTEGEQYSNKTVSIDNECGQEQQVDINKVQVREQKQTTKRQQRPKTYNESLALDDSHQQKMSSLKIKNYISNQITKASKQDEQLDKFTQLGISTMIQQKYSQLEGKIQLKLVELKNQLVEQRIEKQFKPLLINEIQLIVSKDLQALQSQLTQKMQQLDHTLSEQLTTKGSRQQVRQDVKQILQSVNIKVNNLMDDCYHKFAERSQTKRAILFLEKKINKLVETAHRFNIDANIDDQDRVKCLSCNRGFTVNGGDNLSPQKLKSQHYEGQPMLGQVHLLQKSTQSKYLQQQLQTSQNMMIPKMKKNNESQIKNVIRFKELSKFNSVGEIFQSNQRDQHDHMRQSPGQWKLKKSSQTASSLNVNSNSMSKYLNHICENRPTTSTSIGVINNGFNQKSWKEKATNLLKKDHSAINWRSKSQYKK